MVQSVATSKVKEQHDLYHICVLVIVCNAFEFWKYCEFIFWEKFCAWKLELHPRN